MNFDSERPDLDERLQQGLAQLNETTVDELKQEKRLGEDLNFAEGIPVFQRTLDLFRKLSESKLDSLPTGTLHGIVESVEQANTDFEAIKNFTPLENQAHEREQFIERVHDHYREQFDRIAPIIAYSVRVGTDFGRLETNAQAVLKRLERLAAQAEEEATAATKKLDETLQDAQAAAAEMGVSQHSIHFKNEADRHQKRKVVWQWITVGIGVVILIAGVWNLCLAWSENDVTSVSQVVQIGLAKLFLFGVLSFGLVWASRVFRAESHNVVINRHRQNSLSSFKAFVSATGDESTKNAVLVQATRSIFSHQPSGFVQVTQGKSGDQMTEVIRSLPPTPAED